MKDTTLNPTKKEKLKKRKKNQMELFLCLFERFRASSRYFRAVIPTMFQLLCINKYELASDVWEKFMDDKMKEKGFLAALKVFVFARMREAMKEVVRTRDRTGVIGTFDDGVLVEMLLRGVALQFGTLDNIDHATYSEIGHG